MLYSYPVTSGPRRVSFTSKQSRKRTCFSMGFSLMNSLFAESLSARANFCPR